MTAVHPRVAWTLAAVAALLVVASLLVAVLRRARPERDWTELRLRVRTWWVIVGTFTGVLLLSRATALVFFAFVSFLALKEFLSLIPTRRADRRVLFWAYLAIPFQYWWIAREWYGVFIIFIPVYAFLFLSTRVVLTGQTEGFLRAIGTLHWGLMTTVFSLSHAAYLLVLPTRPDAPAGGPGLLLFLVLLTQGNDVAQYCWGKPFGRRKVVPTVSPGKSWVGLLGGVATTTVVAVVLAPWLTPFASGVPLEPSAGTLASLWARHAPAAAAGLLIGIAGFFGDINVSAFKRDLGIKDSGSILPGHGGILDRVNSLTFTAPLFFHFTWYGYY